MENLQSNISNLSLKENTNSTSKKKETFYITTAIHYANGEPHMGHAYENITSDVLARYHRQYGRDVFYCTGTDEHGQKIDQTAIGLGITPLELCDKYTAKFQQLTKDLNMSNDYFIRTTSGKHKQYAQYAFQKAMEKGDIYLDTYEGWYNVREETFVTETEAQTTNYLDPVSNVPLKKMKESSYFFRLSKYQKQLLDYFYQNPKFLQPESRRQEILRRLENDELLDLSVSRTTFKHGIPLPNDPSHVLYVWFDALTNYLTAIDMPNGPNASKYWPCNVHIIGKDIVWFHTVIWPCILMSLDLPLPKCVFGHGFINANDGKKMSKSLGNVINPYDMIHKFGIDSFRYYLVHESRYGSDMPFSEANLLNTHNADLADNLGNLVHRTMFLCSKYCSNKIPTESVDLKDVPFNVKELRDISEEYYQSFALQEACIALMNSVKETNKYLTEKQPWHIKDNDEQCRRIVRTILEAIYVAAHYLLPIIPSSAMKIFEKLGTSPKEMTELSTQYDNLIPGTETKIGEILFTKQKTDEEKAKEEKKKMEEKENKKKKNAKQQTKQPAEISEYTIFNQLDIRVGQITKVWEHPESTKLYCEEIDVGLDEPLQIGSGLRQFYKLDEMQNAKVLVLCNLKPAKLAGFKSFGMVLCASNDAHDAVEFVRPPDGAVVGERVFLEGETIIDPLSGAQVQKQKTWEKASEFLKTNDINCASFKDKLLMTSAGPCKSETLKASHIS